MTIRTYRSGDEVAQVGIYNEAAEDFAKFKPATLDEVRRRRAAPDFDPAARFYAIEDGRPVAYCTFQPNGRVSYPWCRKGYEGWAEPLFERVLDAMRDCGMRTAFAAYRGDWPEVRDFFLSHRFAQTREMLNYCIDLVEMPTPAPRTPGAFTPLLPEDVPDLLAMAPDVLRVSREELERWLFQNPYFPPSALYVTRGRDDGKVTGVGILIVNDAYANPKQIDAGSPCFRLGAFGTEGLTTKRINGMFSFLTADRNQAMRTGVDLMGHAAYLLLETEVETLAAQVPSDAAHLVRFYKQNFRQQGRFPVYERAL